MDQRRLSAIAVAGFAIAGLLCRPAYAGIRNDVPSCYAANNIEPADGLGYTRLIYVLIDQTVGWNADISQAIVDNVNANLTPGTKFVIAEFSAFSQGRYLDVMDTGIIESPMPEAQFNNTPIQKDKVFEACLADQRPYAVALADNSVVSILKGSASSLGHSDIMAALQAISGSIAMDPATHKMLLLASDGLENSSVTSFYRHGVIRDIDPQAEIQRVAAAGLFGNFGGARVFVIGGALAGSASASAGYRSDAMLQHLALFWQLYFRKSNSRLMEFGEPALLQPAGF